MARLRDILQQASAEKDAPDRFVTAQAPTEPGEERAAPQDPSTLHEESDLPSTHAVSIVPLESQRLYSELLAASQRLVDDVHRHQPVTVGDVPSLVERLIAMLRCDDGELMRLSVAEESAYFLASHLVNVAILAVRVGLECGLQASPLRELGVAALLHDLGMARIADVVDVPAALDQLQMEVVRQHPLLGQQLLDGCEEVSPAVRELVSQEHEREDGSGYPNRLRGQAVQASAQVLGLVDVYEALTHDRPHRRRLIPSEAIRMVVASQRTAFRQEFLRAFLQAVPIFPVGSWVRLKTGELARVSRVRQATPLTPIVEVMVDSFGLPCAKPQTHDLAKEPLARTIVEGIPAPSVDR